MPKRFALTIVLFLVAFGVTAQELSTVIATSPADSSSKYEESGATAPSSVALLFDDVSTDSATAPVAVSVAQPSMIVETRRPQRSSASLDAGVVRPPGLVVVTGFETDLVLCMSYKNPVSGGFAAIRWTSPGRLSVWNNTEASNDQKTYNKDGWYLSDTTEVGFRISKIFTPTAVSYFGRQSNSAYTKAMLSPGLGLRADAGRGLSLYLQYMFPDVLSFNHASRFVWGVDQYFPTKHGLVGYIGVAQSLVLLDQPLADHVDHDAGFTVSFRAGVVFGQHGLRK